MDSRELTPYMPNYQCKTPDFRLLGVPFWPFLALWAVRYPGFLGWSKWGLFGVLLAIWLGAKKGSQRGPKTGQILYQLFNRGGSWLSVYAIVGLCKEDGSRDRRRGPNRPFWGPFLGHFLALFGSQLA